MNAGLSLTFSKCNAPSFVCVKYISILLHPRLFITYGTDKNTYINVTQILHRPIYIYIDFKYGIQMKTLLVNFFSCIRSSFEYKRRVIYKYTVNVYFIEILTRLCVCITIYLSQVVFASLWSWLKDQRIHDLVTWILNFNKHPFSWQHTILE